MCLRSETCVICSGLLFASDSGARANKASSILRSFSDSLVYEVRQNHERPRHYHAVGMPFAVIESGATYLCVALRTVVISPHVILASLDFSLHGIAAKIEGPNQEQRKVQNAHNHCSEEQLSQKPVQHSALGVLRNGLQNLRGRMRSIQ